MSPNPTPSHSPSSFPALGGVWASGLNRARSTSKFHADKALPFPGAKIDKKKEAGQLNGANKPGGSK